MDPLDQGHSVQSSDLTGVGSDSIKLDGRPDIAVYPQPYSDASLLHFAGPEALSSPPLAFPAPDPSSFQYTLTANAIASAQHQQHKQRQQSEDSKKEIKKRTKTGCLTCRKRRIKCDETQPVCNNCRKSKRDCQGYDPLFRNQHSPATIQPASSISSTTKLEQHSLDQSAYPAPPAGYAAVQSPTFPVATMAHVPNGPATFDFSAAIDPALQDHVTAPLNVTQSTGAGGLFNSSDAYMVDVRETLIEKLMEVGAPFDNLPMPSAATIEERKSEIKALFTYYAPGLNKFLETQWYQQHGYAQLQKSPVLLQKFTLLLSRMEFTADQHPYENQINLTIEAHMILGSLELAKIASMEAQLEAAGRDGSAAPGDTETKKPPEQGGHIDVHETAARLNILTTLITNRYLPTDFLPRLARFDNVAPAGFNALSKQLLARERKFWKHTAKFLTMDTDQTTNDLIDLALQDMRGLLESKENRDIMYSVAVMRVWPRRLMDRELALKNEGHANPQLDEEDLKKVEVAKTFLTQQAGGRGTTPASQRICGMILKGWGPRPFTI